MMDSPFLLVVIAAERYSSASMQFPSDEPTLEDIPARVAPRSCDLASIGFATSTRVDRESTDAE
jgi:hypothetical protein